MPCLGSIEEKVRVRARERDCEDQGAHSRKRGRGDFGTRKKRAQKIHVVIEEGKVNLPVSMWVFCSVMSWRMQCNERMRRKLMDVKALHSFGEGKNDRKI